MLGLPGAAIADLSSAIKINPNDSDAYFIRGAIKRDQDLYILAMEDFNKAISIDSHRDATEARAILCQKIELAHAKILGCFG